MKDMITAEDLKWMVHRGESYNVDFKVAVPQKVRDITEEVCSFANASGGYIVYSIIHDNIRDAESQ